MAGTVHHNYWGFWRDAGQEHHCLWNISHEEASFVVTRYSSCIVCNETFRNIIVFGIFPMRRRVLWSHVTVTVLFLIRPWTKKIEPWKKDAKQILFYTISTPSRLFCVRMSNAASPKKSTKGPHISEDDCSLPAFLSWLVCACQTLW